MNRKRVVTFFVFDPNYNSTQGKEDEVASVLMDATNYPSTYIVKSEGEKRRRGESKRESQVKAASNIKPWANRIHEHTHRHIHR